LNSVESDDAPGESAGSIKASAIFHILPEAYFAQLSRGDGSPEVIKFLWTCERSRRLLLLRAVHDDINRDSEIVAQLPTIGESWRVLGEAQAIAPDRFADLIMIPQLGSSLAYTLRRSRGGAKSTAPLHIDYGLINTLALSAAALAGLPFTTTVPLRDGCVMVPYFGMARFDGCDPWDVAEAGVNDGRISLRHGDSIVAVPADPSTDAHGWWGLRRLSFGDGPTLMVSLDDIDPLRDLADPVPPVRLSDVEVDRWAALLGDAWRILSDTQPELAESAGACVTSFVPLPSAEGWDTRSASTGDAFGAVLCSPPPDAVTLAVALAHEFMHIKLGALIHLLPLSQGGDTPCLYAPWRDDPRPLGGLIQGIYAFVGIAAFWRRYRDRAGGVERNLADFEYAYVRSQAKAGLVTARSATGVTLSGRQFLAGLDAAVAKWDSDQIPADACVLARLVADGHRAGWRIRHCDPDPEMVTALAAAWTTKSLGRIRIGQSTIRQDNSMEHWSQARLGLARRRIVSQARYLDAREEAWGAALTDGDVALFAGDTATAIKGFVVQIADDRQAVDAWTGLGLALTSDRTNVAAHALGAAILDRPEVMLATYRKIAAESETAPSPIYLARWVGAVQA